MKHNTKHSLSFVGETLKNVMKYHAKEAVSIILQ